MKKYFLTLFVCVGLLPFLAAEQLQFYTLLSQPIGIFKEAETQHDTTVSDKFKVGFENGDASIEISAGTFGNSENKINALVVESGAIVKINRLDDDTLKNVNAARGDSTSAEYVAGIVQAHDLYLTDNTTTKVASFDTMTIKDTAKLDSKVTESKSARWGTICEKGQSAGRTVLTTASSNCSGEGGEPPEDPNPPSSGPRMMLLEDDVYVVYSFQHGVVTNPLNWWDMAEGFFPGQPHYNKDVLPSDCWPTKTEGDVNCPSCQVGAIYVDYSDCNEAHYAPGCYDLSCSYCTLVPAQCY